MSADWISADWPAPAAIIAGTTLRTGRIEDLRLPGEPCWLQQVHGTNVVRAMRYPEPPQADASISEDPAAVCVVQTADCLPVLLCAVNGTEVAAAHAGWRGLAAGIIEATVAGMSHAPDSLIAWLGPAISQAAFEVGDEVRQAFVDCDSGAAVCFEANARGRWQADLYALARRRLLAAGVAGIYGGGFCTHADNTRFFSYRRRPDCGRMVSIAAIRALENTGRGAI